MEQQKEVVIYSLLPKHIERIFQGNNIFCKYVGRGKPNIKEGYKLLFYASGSQCQVLGEAIITSIEFLAPGEIVSKYEGRLFITKDELDNYRKQRGRSIDKKLMVLKLSDVRRYNKHIKTSKVITMAGQTLTKTEYKMLLSKLP